MKKIALLLVALFFMQRAASPTSLEKLQASKLTVLNQTNKKLSVTITSNYSCKHCKSDSHEKETIQLEQGKSFDYAKASGVLTGITTDTKNITNQILKKESSLTIALKDKVNAKEVEKINMMSSLSEDYPLEKVLDAANNGAMSVYKPLRGLKLSNISPEYFYQKLEDAYNKNFKNMISNKPKKIPEAIHLVWLGSPMPCLYHQKRKQWKKMHPGWKIICWTEDLLSKNFPNGLINQDILVHALQKKNFAKASDVIRYEIIAQYGGLYTDIDFECLDSFSPLHNMYDFYGSLESPRLASAGCLCGIFAAKPKHPIVQKCIYHIKKYQTEHLDLNYSNNPHSRELEKTWLHTGPGVITKSIFEELCKGGNRDIVFPYQYLAGSSFTQETKPYHYSFSSHSYNIAEHPEEHWSSKAEYD